MIPFYEHKTALLQVITGNDMNFPLHLHLGPEFFYVTSGEISVQIADNEHILKAGELAIIFPNMAHAYKTITHPQETSFQLLIFHHTIAGELTKTITSSHPICPFIAADNLHHDVPYAISSLILAEQAHEGQQVIQAFSQLIWARVLPFLKLRSNNDSVFPELVVSVITYISAHFKEKLSLEILSKKFGVGRYQLSRLFSNTIHVSFNDYINSMRIDYAKSLIVNTNIDILGAGLECGFESQQTFNRVFKELCGVTPKQYRASQVSSEYEQQ